MSTPPRNLPRFLPMLTEVVHPADLARRSVSPLPEQEEIVQSVMQRVSLLLEQRLCAEAESMARKLVIEQLQSLREQLRQELELVVRQAVSEAMTLRSDFHK